MSEAELRHRHYLSHQPPKLILQTLKELEAQKSSLQGTSHKGRMRDEGKGLRAGCHCCLHIAIQELVSSSGFAALQAKGQTGGKHLVCHLWPSAKWNLQHCLDTQHSVWACVCCETWHQKKPPMLAVPVPPFLTLGCSFTPSHRSCLLWKGSQLVQPTR